MSNINIGKKVLFEIIGTVEKYQTINYKLMDNENCKKCDKIGKVLNGDCSIHKSKVRFCNSCVHNPNKLKPIVSVNERHLYDCEKESLSLTASRIFLYLHTLNPEKNGLIPMIDLDDLRADLNLNKSTMYQALAQLRRKHYIFMISHGMAIYDFFLIDYTSYFFSKEKGGHGYLKLSDEIICELLKIKSKPAFRIIIRSLLECDTNKKGINRTYSDLTKVLPTYCKRKVIITKLKEANCKLLNICFASKRISITLKPEYDIKQNYKNQIDMLKNKFESLINKINYTVISGQYNNDYENGLFFFDDNNNPLREPVMMPQRPDELILDLSRLSYEYSYGIVLEAFSNLYKTVMCRKKKIKSYGAYLRNLIENSFINNTSAVPVSN